MFQGCVRGRGSHVRLLPCKTAGEHKVLVTEPTGGVWGPPWPRQELCRAKPGQELPVGGLVQYQEVTGAGPQIQIQVCCDHRITVMSFIFTHSLNSFFRII